ncbi:hypothetical protein rosag_08540 [Roseisolibacter agri]|uniref:Uncharacterized protein n=1 Tax=Roseisolibacter agri TaxID=2014610 RepID=A0AA37V5N3_9BACT|nr:hypothetical protein rosag_08540 [Roseisolibacter agri]
MRVKTLFALLAGASADSFVTVSESVLPEYDADHAAQETKVSPPQPSLPKSGAAWAGVLVAAMATVAAARLATRALRRMERIGAGEGARRDRPGPVSLGSVPTLARTGAIDEIGRASP